MASELIYLKPRLWCLMLHQVAWFHPFRDESISECPWCKRKFKYPTKKIEYPEYKKYE